MQGADLEIIVKKAQAGDRHAVERLLSLHKQAVFALALTFLKVSSSQKVWQLVRADHASLG